MGSSAGKFLPRAPRYLLRPLDRNILRLKTSGTSVSTFSEISDLSESGLSFDLTGGDPPREHEILKVEFTVPGQGQIACFATVTRVEAHVEDDGSSGKTVRVAIRFRSLPRAHRRSLHESLSTRANVREGEIPYVPAPVPNVRQTVRFALACALLVVAFFMMTG